MKKIALVGFGRENESAYRHFARQGHDITIFDESLSPALPVPSGVKANLGKDKTSLLFEGGFDLVLRTPPINPSRLRGLPVWSATREFFAQCPAPIIGVTGTKGKGTTASLIDSILRAAGIKCHLVGNIGKPALDILDNLKGDEVVVYELSSFQLWDMEQSPQTAVVLMIEPDHLDVHPSFDDYLRAKGNITRWQKAGDVCVYLGKNSYSRQLAELSSGDKLPFGQPPGAYTREGYFWMNEQKICSIQQIKLPGAHNLLNACAAITAAWRFTNDPRAIAKGLALFEGLDHRLKLVGEVAGAAYYDDSIATTPGSAIAAIRAFKRPKILILGGSDKGAYFGGLIKEIARSRSVKAVIAVGTLGSSIARGLAGAGFKNVVNLGLDVSMPEVVNRACALAKKGDVVVLSPAAASFDMFKSYEDRGEQFKAAVKRLQAAAPKRPV